MTTGEPRQRHRVRDAPLATEASDLQLGAGSWPAQLPTTLGNKLPFMRRSKKVDADGDIMWVTYEQANGCLVLRVYND